MSAKWFGPWLAVGALLLGVVTAQALVPSTMTYQGYLAGVDGQPLETTVMITFTLSDAPVGGNALWSEGHSVEVVQGLFSVELGSGGSPLSADLLAGASWLGIKVGDGPEMTPRRALSSVAFALKTAEADSLQGATAADLDQSGHVGSVANPHAVSASQIGAASGSTILALQGQLEQALEDIAALQLEVTNAFETIGPMQVDLAAANATIVSLQNDLAAAGVVTAALSTRVDLVEGNSVLALDGKLSLIDPATAQFVGVNVQVINGVGDSANGVGNLIVGYDSARTTGDAQCSSGIFVDQTSCEDDGGVWALSHKSGSHNLVIGNDHNYSSHGGLLAGELNSSLSLSAVVAGGYNNTASGVGSMVSGGVNNTASGRFAIVSGGQANTASGPTSSIIGGASNTAVAAWATVSGGDNNTASGRGASVSGGRFNTAVGIQSSISGGFTNTASALLASVSGGQSNTASGEYASISGGQSNTASGDNASISGGSNNAVSGESSSDLLAEIAARLALATRMDAVEGNSVLALDGKLSLTGPSTARFSGVNVQVVDGTGNAAGPPSGLGNLIVGYDLSRDSGDLQCSLGIYVTQAECQNAGGVWDLSHKSGSHNLVVGNYNNYSGYGSLVAGTSNSVLSNYASVSGGKSNQASALWSSVTGGSGNVASGRSASISGGEGNTANGNGASVSGGINNTASGVASSASGGSSNTASELAATVSGGQSNTASGFYSSVSGGRFNAASGRESSISGGSQNSATVLRASVSGGLQNTSSGEYASVSGGRANTASGVDSSVSGGLGNWASGEYASVSGGSNYTADGEASSALVEETAARIALDARLVAVEGNSVLTLDGMLSLVGPATAQFVGVNVQVVDGSGSDFAQPTGLGNLIVGYDQVRTTGAPQCSLGAYIDQATCVAASGVWAISHKSGSHNLVVGAFHNYSSNSGLLAGSDNSVLFRFASVSGGKQNTANGTNTSVSGGRSNTASNSYSSVSGGYLNVASGEYSSVSAGRANSASNAFSSVSGGILNAASGPYSSVNGGTSNTASGSESTVSAGNDNTASGGGSSVSAGTNNNATDLFSSVSGGDRNTASGQFSNVSGGVRNTASHQHSTVIGGLDIQTNANRETRTGELVALGEVTTTALNITSDRNTKEQFKPIDARQVLEKVAVLPISEWQFKTYSDARHIGPMAQDFRAAFGVGRNESHITSVDADGVALAAIQGLNEKLEEQVRDKNSRIEALQNSLDELKRLVNKLADRRKGAEQ